MNLFIAALLLGPLAAGQSNSDRTPPPTVATPGFIWAYFPGVAWGQVQISYMNGKRVTAMPGKFVSAPPMTVQAAADPSHMYLRLNIDGGDHLFILDTSEAESTLSPKAWPKYKGKQSIDLNISGDPKRPNLITAKFGTSEDDYGQTAFINGDQPETESIDGILGNDFLSNRALMFDALHQRAMIWNSDKTEFAVPLGWAMQDAEENVVVGTHRGNMKAPWHQEVLKIDVGGSATVAGSIDGQNFDFLVDTSYPETLLKESSLAQVTRYLIGQNKEADPGSKYKPSIYLIKDLSFSFFTEGVAPAISDVDGFDAVLGNDTLNRGMWLIDRKHNEFAFKAYENTESLPEYSLSIFRQIGDQIYMSMWPLTLEPEITKIDDAPAFKTMDLRIPPHPSADQLITLGKQMRVMFGGAPHVTAEFDGEESDVSMPEGQAVIDTSKGLLHGVPLAGATKPPVVYDGDRNDMPPPPPGDPARGMGWQFDGGVGWHEIPVPSKPSEDPLDPQTYREIRGIGYWETKLMHVERSGDGIAIVPIKETPEELKARVERLNARYANFSGPIFITPDGFVNPIVLDGGPLHLPKGTTTKGLNWKREDLASGDFIMVPPTSQQTKKDGVPIYYSAGKSIVVPAHSTAMYLQEIGPYQAGDWRPKKDLPGMLKLINPIYDEKKWSNFFMALR